jgi:hypothetical protein
MYVRLLLLLQLYCKFKMWGLPYVCVCMYVCVLILTKDDVSMQCMFTNIINDSYIIYVNSPKSNAFISSIP